MESPFEINPFASYEDERASLIMRELIKADKAIDTAATDAEKHTICAELDELFTSTYGDHYLISGRLRIDDEPVTGASLIAKLGRTSLDSKGRYYDVHDLRMQIYGTVIDRDGPTDPGKLALLMVDPDDPGEGEEESIYYSRVSELFRVAPDFVTPEIAQQRLETYFPDIAAIIETLPEADASKQEILAALQKLDIVVSADALNEHNLAKYVDLVLNDRYQFRQEAVQMTLGGLALTHAKDGSLMSFNIHPPRTMNRSFIGSIIVDEAQTPTGEHRLGFFLTTYVPYGSHMGEYSGLIMPVRSVGALINAKRLPNFMPEEAVVFSQYPNSSPRVAPKSAETAGQTSYGRYLEDLPYYVELRMYLEGCDEALQATLQELADLPKPSLEDPDAHKKEMEEYVRGVGEIWSRFFTTYRHVLERFPLEVTGPGVALPNVSIDHGEDEEDDDELVIVRKIGDGVRRDSYTSYTGSYVGIHAVRELDDEQNERFSVSLALSGDPQEYSFKDAIGRELQHVTTTAIMYAEVDRHETVVTIPELEKLRARERAHDSVTTRMATNPEIARRLNVLYHELQDEDPSRFQPIDADNLVKLFADAGKDSAALLAASDIIEDMLGAPRALKLIADIITKDEDEDPELTEASELEDYAVVAFKYVAPTHPTLETGPVLVCEVAGEEVYVVIDSIEEVHI